MVKHLYKHKKLDAMKISLSWLSIILHWLEILIAVLVIGFVIIGAAAIIQSVMGMNFAHLGGSEFYHTFEGLLSNVLLIIIGVELAILLVRRSPESLVEVMFFVVARKMLVKSHSIWDLVIGVAAIAGLFAVRKYLEHTTPERQLLEVHKR
jgi:hypothetical protein